VERLRILGQRAPCSVCVFVAARMLPNRDAPMDACATLQAARDGHGALAAHCHAELFTLRLVVHGKAGWKLRASLAEDVAP
jgi:hypothetical protein